MATLTLQPDAAAGKDTLLRLQNPDTNWGTNASVVIGEDKGAVSHWRSLIQFDLSGLADNAIISAATFSLYATIDQADNATTFRVFRVKRAWVEAEATWNVYSTGNSWQIAGAAGADDRELTDIGSRAFSSTETLNQWKDFALTPTTKAGLDLGNGWFLKADLEDNTAYYFGSSDDPVAGQRPKLVIEYTLPETRSFGAIMG